MADDSTLEAKIADLTKTIQDQARFTRAVVLMCAGAVLGMTIWSMTEIVSLLPATVVGQFMTQMPIIVTQWNYINNTANKHGKTPAELSQSAR